MSEDVDRKRVLLTTRVRTSLKNDLSWLHRSKETKEDDEKPCSGGGDGGGGDSPAENTTNTRVYRDPVRQHSYVFSTAKKFDASANPVKFSIKSPSKHAQPEGSTVEITDKPQASTEELVQHEPQPVLKEGSEAPVGPDAPSATADKNEAVCLDSPIDEAKVESSEEAAEVVQHGETQAVSEAPVEPDAPSAADATADKNEAVCLDSPVDEAKVESSEEAAEVVQHGETQAVSEVPVEPDAPSATADKNEAVCVDSPVDESKVESSEASAEVVQEVASPVEPDAPSAADKNEAVCLDSPVDESKVASSVEAAEVVQHGETQPVSEVPVEPDAPSAADATADKNEAVCLDSPVDESKVASSEEATEVVQNGETQPVSTEETEAAVEPDAPPVADKNEAACLGDSKVEESIEEAVLPWMLAAAEEVSVLTEATEAASPAEPDVPPVPNTVSETNEECVDEPELNEEAPQSCADICVEVQQNDETQPEETETEPPVEPVANTPAENKEEKDDGVPAAAAVAAADTAAADTAAAAADTAAAAADTAAAAAVAAADTEAPAAETVAEVEIEQSKDAAEVLAVPAETVPKDETNQEPGVESSPHPAEEVVETVVAVAAAVEESSPESPAVTNAAAGEEAAVQASVETHPDVPAVAESNISTEAAAETAEEEEKTEVPAAAVEAELKIEDALLPATDAASSVQEEPAAEAAEEQEKSSSEETEQKSEEANTVEVKDVDVEPATEPEYESRDGQLICTFCKQINAGNVRIKFSEPLVSCHPECLKCGVCSLDLGDLLTPMFLHDQVVHCGGCFALALKI